MDRPRTPLADLRGLSRLAVEATRGLTDVVEAMHATIARRPAVLGAPSERRTRGISGLVYRNVRGVTRIVGKGTDALLAGLAPFARETEASPTRDAFAAALNGVLGDRLAAEGNELATPMRLRLGRAGDAPLARGPRAVVLIHGLCRDERQWARRGHDHGAALARDAGTTPLYLRYNSGLHVSENGRDLAALLEELVAGWPVPLEELSIVAHSMGGLVARSAHHQAAAAGHRWPRLLSSMVFLGTPHHGAPLERGGHGLNRLLPASPYSAPLARLGWIRSAGITDLRHGSLLEDDWRGRDPFATGSGLPRHVPLPRGVRCCAIAASLAERPGSLADALLGDGVVPVASALGRNTDPRRALAFPAAHLHVARGAGHLDLLDRADVYEKVRGFLAGKTL